MYEIRFFSNILVFMALFKNLKEQIKKKFTVVRIVCSRTIRYRMYASLRK